MNRINQINSLEYQTKRAHLYLYNDTITNSNLWNCSADANKTQASTVSANKIQFTEIVNTRARKLTLILGRVITRAARRVVGQSHLNRDTIFSLKLDIYEN